MEPTQGRIYRVCRAGHGIPCRFGPIGGPSAARPAAVIRAALSRALADYRPFAGRFVGSLVAGEACVAYTDDGAWFVEAVADCRLDDVNVLDYPLMVCEEELLPAPEEGVDPTSIPVMMQKVRRLAEFYPNDIISSTDLIKLELQLDNYIDDIRQDDRFKGLHNLVDLSVKLAETKRHIVYDLVYMLLKLVLLLPVATASVERVFSAISLVKSKLRNKMGDSFLDDCLVTFIERDIFFEVDEDDIIKSFMAIRRRRPNKK